MSVFKKEPETSPQACIIWMHGLGADASDMVGLSDALPLAHLAIRHVFMNAPKRPVTINNGMVMPAWYDIKGMELSDKQDEQGLEHSASLIRKVMEEQLNDGFRWDQIFLAGFSQGVVMALHTALNAPEKLGGIIALSGCLPTINPDAPKLDKQTPIFIGYGQFDPIVLPLWVEISKDWLVKNGYSDLSIHEYPIEHSISMNEIQDLSLWINKQIAGVV